MMAARKVPDAIRREWPKPEPNWLSLQHAPFHFFPAFAAPGAGFHEQIRRIIGIQRNAPALTISTLAPAIVAVDGADVRLIIDAESAQFYLEVAPVDGVRRGDENLSDDFDPQGPPDEFLRSVEGLRKITRAQYVVGVDVLYRVADILVMAQKRLFEEALQNGHAVIVGRWDRLKSFFTVIEPDQWRYFKVRQRDGLPVASHGDEVIYSPMVMPILRAVSAKQQRQQDGVEWLISIMSQVSEPRIPKKTLQDEAIRRWPDLTDREFFRMWDKAISSIPSTAYGRPGRPAKNLAPTLVKS